MDEQGRWMTRLLEASLQSSGLSERELEERLGWEEGLLGRILDGTAEGGPLQLLEILAELSAERRGNSTRLRKNRGTQIVQELLGRFRNLGYGQSGALPATTVPAAPGDIEGAVEGVLQQAFGKKLGKRRRGG
jgi:hypothetical protein